MNAESEFIRNKVAAYTTIMVQIAITFVAAALFWINAGEVAGYSSLLGGIASFVPSAAFARCAYRYSAANSPDKVVKWFMVGEAGKVILTVLIFISCITQIKPLSMPIMFATFLLVLVANMVGSGILQARYNNDDKAV
jgi:ATP synthase protein I